MKYLSLFIVSVLLLMTQGCSTTPQSMIVPPTKPEILLKPCQRPTHLLDNKMGTLLEHDFEMMKRLKDCADQVDALIRL